MHPTEAGATLVFSKQVSDDATVTATRWTPEGYDAFNMVHEYGGAAFIVDRDTVYFTNLQVCWLTGRRKSHHSRAIIRLFFRSLRAQTFQKNAVFAM